MESPEINPCFYGQKTCDKGGKTTQWRKDNLFNKWCWENWSMTCKKKKKNETRTLSNTIQKINSKLITDPNVGLEATKFLEENIGKTLSDINHSRVLCDPPLRVMEIKAKINNGT